MPHLLMLDFITPVALAIDVCENVDAELAAWKTT